MQFLRRALRQIDPHAGAAALRLLDDDRRPDHEDDQQHEKDVGERRDVDLAEHRRRELVVVVMVRLARTGHRHFRRVLAQLLPRPRAATVRPASDRGSCGTLTPPLDATPTGLRTRMCLMRFSV